MANIHFLNCSEFVGEDGSDKFWQFVDTVKELSVYKQGGTSSETNIFVHHKDVFTKILGVFTITNGVSYRVRALIL